MFSAYGLTITVLSALASLAGALLTMIANTMIPEAVEGEHQGTGLLVVLGLLIAFALSTWAELDETTGELKRKQQPRVPGHPDRATETPPAMDSQALRGAPSRNRNDGVTM